MNVPIGQGWQSFKCEAPVALEYVSAGQSRHLVESFEAGLNLPEVHSRQLVEPLWGCDFPGSHVVQHDGEDWPVLFEYLPAAHNDEQFKSPLPGVVW